MSLPRRCDAAGTHPLKRGFHGCIEGAIAGCGAQADIRNTPGTAHIKHDRHRESNARKVRGFDPRTIKATIELITVTLQGRALSGSETARRIMHRGRQVIL